MMLKVIWISFITSYENSQGISRDGNDTPVRFSDHARRPRPLMFQILGLAMTVTVVLEKIEVVLTLLI